jgi:hypothetical protein
MSLINNLRELSKRSKVHVVMYLENSYEVDTGYWPGSHFKNLNNFLMELETYNKNSEEVFQINLDEFKISFE